MISDEQIALVQQSFAKVVPISQMAAVMFYDKLFEDRPDFRALFPEDMETQLGEDWNPELEKAWSAAYAMLAKVMINAANQKAA